MGSVPLSEAEAAEVKQAWVEEVDRRATKLESGESSAIPIEAAWPKVAGKSWRPQSAEE
jgi:hypothetical protein